MPSNEVLDYSINPASALKALADINASIANTEGKFVNGGKNIEQSLKAVTDTILKLSDREYQANERLTKSVEARAVAEGKSNIDRLIAQRDAHIKKLGSEKEMIDRVTTAYDKLIEKAKQSESGGGGVDFKGYGQMLQSAIQSPLQSISGAATSAAESLGPVGIAIGATVAVAGTAAGVFLSMAESIGDVADQTENFSLRTGIATEDIQTFRFAATSMGIEADVWEHAMKKLSSAMEDSSESSAKARKAMSELGVSMYDALGQNRSTKDVLLQISDGLNNQASATERVAKLTAILGKEAVTMLPALLALRENVATGKLLGIDFTDEEVERLKAVDSELDKLTASWERLKLSAKEAVVFPIMFASGVGTSVRQGKQVEASQAGGLGLIDEKSMDALIRQRLGSTVPGAPSGYATGFNNRIADNDRRVAAAKAALDSQRELAAAEKKLTELQGELKMGVLPSVNDDTLKQIDAQKKVITGIKAQIEATQDLKRLRSESEAFTLSGLEREGNAVEKITIKYSKLYDELKKAGASAKELRSLSDEAIRQADAALKTDNEKTAKVFRDAALKHRDTHDEEIKNGLTVNEKRAKDLLNRAAGIRSASISADQAGLANDEAQELGNARYLGDARINAANLTGRADTIAKVTLQAEVQQIEIKKKYANERFEYELKLAQEKHRNDGQLENVTRELRLKNAKELYDLQLPQSEAVAKSQAATYKRHFDAVKTETDKLVGTLFDNPKQFGSQLKDTLKQAALKPVKDQVSNMASSFLTPMLFGKKSATPELQATDLNTTATNQNTAALYAMASAVSGGGVNAPAFGGMATFGGGGIFGSTGLGSFTTPPFISGGGGGKLPTFSMDNTGGFGGMFGPGGTSGFAGPVGGGSGGGSDSPVGNLSLGTIFGKGHGLKDIKGNLSGWVKGQGGWGSFSHGKDGGINGVDGLAGNALMAGGTMLAMKGLLGDDRGTGKGVLMGAAGGAAIGMKFGGPLGAAIGGAVGLGIDLGEMAAGVESPYNKVKRIAKTKFGVTLGNPMAHQLVNLAKSKYFGNIEMMMASPEVRDQLMLYAAGTGQNMPMSNSPHAGLLAQSNGQLVQEASYKYGHAFTYQSNLPIMGGGGSQNYGMGGPISLSLNIDRQGAGDFMAGNVVTPAFVQSQFSSSQQSSNGRVSNAAMFSQPNLITA